MFGEPDFSHLPEGTEAAFERRIARLPLHRLRSRLDADAILHNELGFLDEFCVANAIEGFDDGSALRTWHFRSVLDRLSAARPDLVPPRSKDGGVMIGYVTVSTFRDRVRHRGRRWCPNFLVGWPTWFKNRWSSARRVLVRRRAAELRRTQ